MCEPSKSFLGGFNMYKVKLIGPGLKIENKWHWIGETVIVNKEDYEKNKKYLEVIEIIANDTSTTANITANIDTDYLLKGVTSKIKDAINSSMEEETEDKSSEDKNETEEEENAETEEDVDEEMEILRKKATELGIEFRKNTKKETLIKKISEAENK